MQNCDNCLNKLDCCYRGITNPCELWSADVMTRRLRTQACKIKDCPLGFEEKRFVLSCIDATSFSPKQINWFAGIYKRCSKLQKIKKGI